MSFLNPITLLTLSSFILSRILGVLYKTLAEVSENEEKADLLMKAEEALQDAYNLRIEMTGGFVRGVDWKADCTKFNMCWITFDSILSNTSVLYQYCPRLRHDPACQFDII